MHHLLGLFKIALFTKLNSLLGTNRVRLYQENVNIVKNRIFVNFKKTAVYFEHVMEKLWKMPQASPQDCLFVTQDFDKFSTTSALTQGARTGYPFPQGFAGSNFARRITKNSCCLQKRIIHRQRLCVGITSKLFLHSLQKLDVTR